MAQWQPGAELLARRRGASSAQEPGVAFRLAPVFAEPGVVTLREGLGQSRVPAVPTAARRRFAGSAGCKLQELAKPDGADERPAVRPLSRAESRQRGRGRGRTSKGRRPSGPGSD